MARKDIKEDCSETFREMKYIYRLLKVKGREYLHIYKGNSTFDMVYVTSAGSADKLAKKLKKYELLLALANKYPEIWANFQALKKEELAKNQTNKKTKGFNLK